MHSLGSIASVTVPRRALVIYVDVLRMESSQVLEFRDNKKKCTGSLHVHHIWKREMQATPAIAKLYWAICHIKSYNKIFNQLQSRRVYRQSSSLYYLEGNLALLRCGTLGNADKLWLWIGIVLGEPVRLKTCLASNVPSVTMTNFLLKRHTKSCFNFIIITQKHVLFNSEDLLLDLQLYET